MFPIREPASGVSDDEQGDLFDSGGPHRNRVLATANAGKARESFFCVWRGGGEREMNLNGPER